MHTGAYDVAIAGGGPAGAAAGVMLARAGLRVLLADAGGGRAYKIGEGLPPSARHLLRDLGALDRVLADSHRPSHGTLAFWSSDTPHTNDFMFQLHGEGMQLDRLRFDATLLELARDAGAEIVRDARLSLATQTDGADIHRLSLRSHEAEHRIECRWLIDASGRPATLARALGATRIEHDALIAFHMRLASDGGSDQDGRTWVEAVENGWWYSVLLPSQERLIAFLSDADLVDRRALLTREGLWHALQDAPHLHTHCRQHRYLPSSTPHGADACSSQLDRAAGGDAKGKRWLAAGDAGLAFDPLSSKGIANALYTGLRGAEAVIAGDSTTTSRYADHLLDIHRVYRAQLQDFYTLQTRWPISGFWRRRHDTGEQPTRLPRGCRHDSEPGQTGCHDA